MPSAGFELAIPEIKRLQTDTLNSGLLGSAKFGEIDLNFPYYEGAPFILL